MKYFVMDGSSNGYVGIKVTADNYKEKYVYFSFNPDIVPEDHKEKVTYYALKNFLSNLETLTRETK